MSFGTRRWTFVAILVTIWSVVFAVSIQACDRSSSEFSIDELNNKYVFPHLKELLQRDFFKFYKVNMEKPCPFWEDDRQCSSKECSIGYCDDEVPLMLRQGANSMNDGHALESVGSTGSDSKSVALDEQCEESNQFDPLDRSLSEGDKVQLKNIDIFDYNEYEFCDIDDESSQEMHYVNLLKNPERYTGYKGDSAVKVWRCIYQENCFKPNPKFDKNFLMEPTTTGMCLEKRVFYRLISGLHTAITISIASHNYKPAPGGFGEGTWFRNFEMFKNRFGTKWSKEGPERLRNLYFVYKLEMRALVKVAPYLQKELFYTGNEEEDVETKQSVETFLDLLKSYPDQFDETQLFTGFDAHARSLREEFRQHFMNISRIMDCVGCDKCRLWGKLQTHGMGTALKILFAELPSSNSHPSLPPTNEQSDIANGGPPFKLTRNEVVALFQSFGRYASSISEVNEFRKGLSSEEMADIGT
ncbi:endoplasmic reticulum oxidoreductin 1 (ERO1) domain-containing protein [Ditylenchus destructor]|uniref:Endoplasmic reticulum oxidoreductin 1 (ERO1) domain-containing protein n=1 Tax=Ditylenchus destructor TaxID=166010 RepID=A0AAD4N5A9_9BILA|nr:endoplasmic reticulum oxidoreductin 1 (ERO1) domain-containing protein [Ditylenchus destructor]